MRYSGRFAKQNLEQVTIKRSESRTANQWGHSQVDVKTIHVYIVDTVSAGSPDIGIDRMRNTHKVYISQADAEGIEPKMDIVRGSGTMLHIGELRPLGDQVIAYCRDDYDPYGEE